MTQFFVEFQDSSSGIRARQAYKSLCADPLLSGIELVIDHPEMVRIFESGIRKSRKRKRAANEDSDSDSRKKAISWPLAGNHSRATDDENVDMHQATANSSEGMVVSSFLQDHAKSSAPSTPETFDCSQTIDASFTLNSILLLTLPGHSQTFSYDLATLDADDSYSSGPLIRLLQVTKSERDKWMIVACHLRRKGREQQAIQVLQSMINGDVHVRFSCKLADGPNTVMTDEGYGSKDLKPAYLMLASCETYLSRKKDSPSAKEHAEQAIKWMQKVYGSGPSEPLGPSISLPEIDTNSSDAHKKIELSAVVPSDMKDVTSERSHDDLVSNHSITTASSRRDDRAEINRLLAREEDLKDRLTTMGNARRALEDERTNSKRIMEELERALKVAKAGENGALEQVRREVGARRKVERDLKAVLENMNMNISGGRAKGCIFGGVLEEVSPRSR